MKKISLSKFVGFLRISGTALSLLALAAPEILAKEAVETDDSVKESSVQKESPTQKIYYVDMQKALQSVSAGKKAKAQLEKEYNSKKEKLQAEETKIKEESEAFKKATESFKKQSDVMNEEGRAKKQADLQGKNAALQERILKYQEQTARSQAEIQQKERDLTQPIIEKLKSTIEQMGIKKSATVLEKGAVLFARKNLDLTDEVISAYDKQAKSSG